MKLRPVHRLRQGRLWHQILPVRRQRLPHAVQALKFEVRMHICQASEPPHRMCIMGFDELRIKAFGSAKMACAQAR